MGERGMKEADVERVKAWCGGKVPEHLHERVRIECEAGSRHLTIVDRRPPWRDDGNPEWTSTPVARLRFECMHWWLLWCDRNSKFHYYEFAEPSKDVDILLDEIDKDPTGIFWG